MQPLNISAALKACERTKAATCELRYGEMAREHRTKATVCHCEQ